MNTSTKKKLRKGAFGLFFVAAGLLLLFLVLRYFNLVFVSHEPFRVIPEDAVYMIETENPMEAWQKISESAIWKHLSKQDSLKDVASAAQTLTDFIHEQKEWLQWVAKRDVVISAHLYNQKEYDFLYVVDLPIKIESQFQNLVSPYLKEYGQTLDTASYKAYPLFLFENKADKSVLTVAFIDNLLVCSYTRLLVEAAIDQHFAPYFSDQKQFKMVESNLSNNGIGNLYVNYRYLQNYMQAVLAQDNPYMQSIAEATLFSGGTLKTKENDKQTLLSLDGYSSLNDTLATYLRALALSGNGKITAPRIISQRAAFYFSLTFDNLETFTTNFQSLLKDSDTVQYNSYKRNVERVESFLKISLEEHFFSWVGNEIAVVQTEPHSSGRKANDEFALIIKTKNINEAKKNLQFIADQIRKRSPAKFKTLEHRGHKISFLAIKGFFQFILGKYFDKIEKPYFTIIEDYVIFSNSPTTLQGIIDDYRIRLVLTEDADFQTLFQEFDQSSNFFFYTKTPILMRSMVSMVEPDTWKSMKRNEDYLICFSQFALQLSESRGNFDTRLATLFEMPQEVRQKEQLVLALRREKLDNIPITSQSSLLDRMTAFLGSEQEQTEATEELMGSLQDLLNINPQEMVDISEVGSADFYRIRKTLERTDEEGKRLKFQIRGGKKDGFYRVYQDGKLRISGNYKDDLPDGVWKFYDENGKMIERRRYKNGEEQKLQTKSLF
ncbi:DUF3352 domain-containing protein [Hugenholtzia roseola]|uniref:DUF3352 domain-containing protein n=1 Tax=Hugenholtzia roseola TaxID=1002 RepID=UPI00047AE1F4|nr:DUF3352 domain-containing protein [Hugenholtzia roseola]